jgi:fibrillarin-like rRNA methylase
MEFQSIVKFYEGEKVDVVYNDGDSYDDTEIIASNEQGIFTKCKAFIAYHNIFCIKLTEEND